MKSDIRFGSVLVRLLIVLIFIIMMGCDSGGGEGGEGGGEGDTTSSSIDSRMTGWWLGYWDEDLTLFSSDGVVIESDGDIFDLDCDDDDSDPNCDWYIDTDDKEAKILKAKDGKITYLDYDDNNEYEGTYEFIGDVLLIDIGVWRGYLDKIYD